MRAMEDAAPSHQQHLEQSRNQVIELLSRQAVERELMQRSAEGGARQDLVGGLVLRQQQAALELRLAQFHPADIAFVMESLAPEARAMAWSLVRPERRGAVLLETSEAVQRSLMSAMRPEEIAAIVRPLESDDIAALLADLPEAQRQAVLTQLDRTDQAEVRSMLSFPEGSIGAIMDLDYISVRADASLEAVHRLLRRRKQLPPHTTQVFVVSRGNELQGLLGVQRLLTEEPETLVSEVMTADPVHFFTDEPVNKAVAAFEKYDLISAPVVNLHRQVVGRITVDAVLQEVAEKSELDALRQAGLSEHEDLYGPVLQSGRNRWPWLALNLITSFTSSRVIGLFDNTIARLTALATLIPIVASLGGNTGTQTMELVIRAMALDQLGSAQLRRTFTKEFLIALLNGSMWGVALGTMTYMLYGNWKLSLAIWLSMLLELVVAAAAGVAIPVTLKRIGRDPVMGSSVLLTAVTDTMGFFILLGLATIFVF